MEKMFILVYKHLAELLLMQKLDLKLQYVY